MIENRSEKDRKYSTLQVKNALRKLWEDMSHEDTWGVEIIYLNTVLNYLPLYLPNTKRNKNKK